MTLWFVNWPMAPSENTRLFAVRGRLVKSRPHRIYRNQCILWAEANQQNVKPIIVEIQQLKQKCESLKQPFALAVDAYFAFPHDRLLTVNNKLQRLDADNLLKATLDGLSTVLKIDDKHFFRASCEKVISTTKESTECTILKITQVSPRTVQQLSIPTQSNTRGA